MNLLIKHLYIYICSYDKKLISPPPTRSNTNYVTDSERSDMSV